MAGLSNSGRSLLKATYVPLKIQPAGRPVDSNLGTGPNVMMKVAFVRSLNFRPSEMKALENHHVLGRTMLRAPAHPLKGKRSTLSLVEVAKDVTSDLSPALMITHGPLLAGATASNLQSLAQGVQTLREKQLTDVSAAFSKITLDYADSVGTTTEFASRAQVVNWALQTRHPLAAYLLQVAGDYSHKVTTSQYGAIITLDNTIAESVAATKSAVDDFLLQFSFQPVGYLHLERLEMVPVGIEHGELVYSVPLTPKETVNISHREWSETTKTFESLVSESFDGFSELGVIEKTDVATATGSETKHSSAFDVNGNVQFSYSGNPYSVTTSAGVDYQAKTDDSTSVKDSHAHSMAITRMASARTRREHKQSFRVTSISGAEDLAVRTLSNPTDNPMRFDYFRLMRRWQVDLIRYGKRMTYDLVVPNPGSSLASKVSELSQLNQFLTKDHKFLLSPSDVNDSNYQTLSTQYGVALDAPPASPGDMAQGADLAATDNMWDYANLQFVVPDDYEVQSARVWAEYTFHGDPDKKLWFGVRDGAFKPEVPQIGGGGNAAVTTAIYDSDDLATDPNRLFSKSLEGRSGQITVDYMWYHVDKGRMTASLVLQPKRAAYTSWQMKSWDALREADSNQFAAALKTAQERQGQLQKEIADYDSLTLRRMEREEIMRLVLLWIFGPSFEFVPSFYEQLVFGTTPPDPATTDAVDTAFPDPAAIPSDWDSVRKFGEFIKFINNAVEWENVLFFSYPYFWDLIQNWPFKKFLYHPDSDHRVFLRAGCARVVLTVRPGFETAFANLVDYFTLPNHTTPDPNAPKTPYVTIGEEVRNYAMTNYEHIPPANPDNNVRPLLHPLQIRAWKEMQDIITLIQRFNLDKHANPPGGVPLDPDVVIYPGQLADLAYLVPLVDADTNKTLVANLPLKDPFGHDYAYSSPGEHGEDYDLVCYGKSGNQVTSGDGLDAWITSYAEGNVVSRWFEYTPTSALDVIVTVGEPKPALM